MESDELITRLLAQNELLINTLAAQNPLAIIAALNPPPAPQVVQADPWAYDVPKAGYGPHNPSSDPLEAAGAALDKWADENIPVGQGWVGFNDDQPTQEDPS